MTTQFIDLEAIREAKKAFDAHYATFMNMQTSANFEALLATVRNFTHVAVGNTPTVPSEPTATVPPKPPAPTTPKEFIWEIAHATEHTSGKLLTNGWEPFGVTTSSLGNNQLVFFRRKVWVK